MRLPAVPNLYYERQYWSQGHTAVAGVDEAGRGAWAGPLVAAAVILPVDSRRRASITRLLTGQSLRIQDSKLLSPIERERVCDVIERAGVTTAVSEVHPELIDEIGIGAANRLAMVLAIERLEPVPASVLVDAFHLPEIRIPQRPLVKGDRRSMSIALASIVAKVHRDRLMTHLDEQFPDYQFAVHKGYGTRGHRRAIHEKGPCPGHRFCFRPVVEAERRG